MGHRWRCSRIGLGDAPWSSLVTETDAAGTRTKWVRAAARACRTATRFGPPARTSVYDSTTGRCHALVQSRLSGDLSRATAAFHEDVAETDGRA